jgi:hypothetical protein
MRRLAFPFCQSYPKTQLYFYMVNLNKKLTLSRVCGKLLNMRLYMRKFYSEHTKMRTSGILLHISSLPSDYGIGTFGREAYRFVDFLSKAGQTY